MNKYLTIINLGLVLALLAGTWAMGNVWLAPSSLELTAESAPTVAPKVLHKPKIERTKLGRQAVSLVAQNNLFRKERREFPTQAVAVGQVAQRTPTPKLTPAISLTGVLLFNGTKIAILNGTNPTVSSPTGSLPIKSKGYKIGDTVGNYRISAIDINSVTLNAPTGKVMTLQLAKRSADQKVQKTGNQLFHKGDLSYLTQGVVKKAKKNSNKKVDRRARAKSRRAAQAERHRSRIRSRNAGVPRIPIVKPDQSLNPNLSNQIFPELLQIPVVAPPTPSMGRF